MNVDLVLALLVLAWITIVCVRNELWYRKQQRPILDERGINILRTLARIYKEGV